VTSLNVVHKFAIQGTQRFIAVVTSTRYWTYFVPLVSGGTVTSYLGFLIQSTHVWLGLSIFLPKMLHEFFTSTQPTCNVARPYRPPWFQHLLLDLSQARNS